MSGLCRYLEPRSIGPPRLNIFMTTNSNQPTWEIYLWYPLVGCKKYYRSSRKLCIRLNSIVTVTCINNGFRCGMQDQRTLWTCHSLVADRWCVDRRLLVLRGTDWYCTVPLRIRILDKRWPILFVFVYSPVLVERQAAPPPDRLQIARSLNYPPSLSLALFPYNCDPERFLYRRGGRANLSRATDSTRPRSNCGECWEKGDYLMKRRLSC